jgi:hypothetical protein
MLSDGKALKTHKNPFSLPCLPLSPAVLPLTLPRCLPACRFHMLPLRLTLAPACRNPCAYAGCFAACPACRANCSRCTMRGVPLPCNRFAAPTKKPQGVTMANHCNPLGRITFTDKREPIRQEKSPRMFQAVTRNPLGLVTFPDKWEPLDFYKSLRSLTVAAQDLKAG